MKLVRITSSKMVLLFKTMKRIFNRKLISNFILSLNTNLSQVTF